MKKYLFGLGAMLVGAGLMFVLMHGEVDAETSALAGESYCVDFNLGAGHHTSHFSYCQIHDLTCISAHNGLSCVKK
jgi:hypothetical protein|tara:strand:- start:50 stop:277 length:228 start_codon:yes stop_codon:yes gene_type:complete